MDGTTVEVLNTDAEGRLGIGVQEVVVDRGSEAELAGFGVEPQQVAAEGLGLERPELADPVLLEMAITRDIQLIMAEKNFLTANLKQEVVQWELR